MTQTVILFLALLALACQVLLAAELLLLITWPIAASRSAFVRVQAAIGPLGWPFAFIVAVVTMAGSLFFSEVAHYPPCHLCWAQRACLYPEVLVTGLGLFRPNWRKWLWPLVVALAVIDLPISAYHYILEWYPTLEGSFCDLRTPCSVVYVRKFGYLSIPLMAATSALTVLNAVLFDRSERTSSKSTPSERTSGA